MRSPLVALIALVLLAPAVAQDGMPAFPETHQYRIAYGDIPSTQDNETEGQWNVQETHQVSTAEDTVLPVPRGAMSLRVESEGALINATFEDDEVRIRFEGNATTATLRVGYALPGAPDRISTEFTLPDGSHVFLYAMDSSFVQAAAVPTTIIPSATVPGLTIYDFDDDLPTRFWFSVSPVAPQGVTTAPGEFSLDYLAVVLGIIAGALLWSFLVARGVVQRRSRKQVAGTAAHKQASAREDQATLAARKRALMAALKDLELAKMNKEIEPHAYDALKAEYKREAVTVMRALEERG